MLILAADVGGTSTRLAYFEGNAGGLVVLAEGHYPSREHGSLVEIVRRFAAQHRLTAHRACFGIAGPVLEGRVRTPNLPWNIEGAELAEVLGLPLVQLINDLEANTYGIAALKPEDLFTLNQGKPDPTGTIAVVSAGTGLGESLAYWDGSTHRPLPSEAGHADFAARNELESELLLYLQAKHGRVSYERVVSGPGLLDIYRFLRDRHYFPEDPAVISAMNVGDAPAVITQGALDNSCPICSKALDIFVAVYGAESGNAALRFLATGGVYLGGGIPPRIIERLKGAAFMVAFTSKGRLSSLVQSIPVHLILNERTALLGAARAAFMLPQ
ncbi:MAG: glucokinase [Geobacteraceae bacterium GWC2_58_44]|nr:MAG: glucokinase [Geobacteraceae bacterium GWC2_58_44]HBG06851.1 glucokinase [Geobacter sp.]